MGKINMIFSSHKCAIKNLNHFQTSTAHAIAIAGIVGPGKRWEHIPTNKNGKPPRQTMHVKKGDTVLVIAGNDKGKIGAVTTVYPKTGRIRVQCKHSHETQKAYERR